MNISRIPDDQRTHWFGTFASHWKVARNKHVMSMRNSKVGDRHGEYDLLSLTRGGIIYRDIESGKGKFPESFDTYQEVKAGDIVFCLFDIDETPRTVGLAHTDGMITGAYTVMKCNKVADPRFVTYFYLSIDERKGLRPFYTGLRKVVRTDTFMNATFPLPDLTTQRQIADFLDRETAHIDLLIEKKQRMVLALGESRGSILLRAVTLGINADAPMKPTTTSWVPTMPAHWAIKKMKFLGQSIIGLTYSPEDLVEEGERHQFYAPTIFKRGS